MRLLLWVPWAIVFAGGNAIMKEIDAMRCPCGLPFILYLGDAV
jgi:hypothetical protein